VKLGNSMILLNLWDKIKKCIWAVIVVYGPAHKNRKEDFLVELSSFCQVIDCLYIVGDDFNILRNVLKKINLAPFLAPLIFPIRLFILLRV
jgi:hypothetical protein